MDRNEPEPMAGVWLCHPPPATPPGMSWWHWGCKLSARAAAGINQQGKVMLHCVLTRATAELGSPGRGGAVSPWLLSPSAWPPPLSPGLPATFLPPCPYLGLPRGHSPPCCPRCNTAASSLTPPTGSLAGGGQGVGGGRSRHCGQHGPSPQNGAAVGPGDTPTPRGRAGAAPPGPGAAVGPWSRAHPLWRELPGTGRGAH